LIRSLRGELDVRTRYIRLAGAAVMATVLWTLAHAGPAPSAAPDPALVFVTNHQLGGKLSGIALAAATRTQTFTTLSARVGNDQAQTLVSRELARSLPKYQSRWDQQLAIAYAKHFSSDELRSLALEGQASKHLGKLAERQNAVGTDMRAAAQQVLVELVSEVLSRSSAQVMR
jgi:hypothetical protein